MPPNPTKGDPLGAGWNPLLAGEFDEQNGIKALTLVTEPAKICTTNLCTSILKLRIYANIGHHMASHWVNQTWSTLR